MGTADGVIDSKKSPSHPGEGATGKTKLGTMILRNNPSLDNVSTGPERGPLLLGARGVAAALGLSVRSVERAHAAGRLPAPVRIGRSCRWRADELRAWVAAGCPSRAEWRWMGGADGQ